MDDKIEKLLVRILYLVLISVSIIVLIRNLDNPWILLLLLGFLSISFTARKALLGQDGVKNIISPVLVFTEIGLVFIMGLLDPTGSSSWLYFILVADAAFYGDSRIIISASVLSFILQGLNFYLGHPLYPFIKYAESTTINVLIIAAILVIVRIIRIQAGQKLKLSETMMELKVKSRELQHTYLKLKETSEELEEMTILQERNRIAREIHDTVGHTLTTVLLELEAAERLITLDPELSKEKLSIAKGQVRKGLSDIRESVHTLRVGHEIMGLEKSLRLLIEDTEKSGAIVIRSNIGQLPELSKDQEKMIYRALQEGLTNGIRHGKSTAFVFQLYEDKGLLKFLLSDNGQGAENNGHGFGLTSMEERVRSLGGTMAIETAPGEGFTISISIPVTDCNEAEVEE